MHGTRLDAGIKNLIALQTVIDTLLSLCWFARRRQLTVSHEYLNVWFHAELLARTPVWWWNYFVKVKKEVKMTIYLCLVTPFFVIILYSNYEYHVSLDTRHADVRHRRYTDEFSSTVSIFLLAKITGMIRLAVFLFVSWSLYWLVCHVGNFLEFLWSCEIFFWRT